MKRYELSESERQTIMDLLRLESIVSPEVRKFNYMWQKIQMDKINLEKLFMTKMEADPQKYRLHFSDDFKVVDLQELKQSEKNVGSKEKPK
ncbi:MAG TPA: hypothetical protein PL042_01765 [Caldisericia bacterium]|nr:hypothetical protein [Caldisericia bacterium]